FSGETHKMINGVDTNGYYTSKPQVDIDAGLNARVKDFYNNGSLQNGGLRVRSGLYPVFGGVWLRPWQSKGHDIRRLKIFPRFVCLIWPRLDPYPVEDRIEAGTDAQTAVLQ
ncbi:hypothetical protein DD577_28900, partial [Klebsiella pneumoniae]